MKKSKTFNLKKYAENSGSDRNRGDDYYNDRPDQYYWADERGWINTDTGEVVQGDDSKRGVFDGETGERYV